MMNKRKTIRLAFLLIGVILLSACAKKVPEPEPVERPEKVEETVEEHVWVPANYQEPETCSDCGETRGDVLTPAFEEKGIVPKMEVGKSYPYEAICIEAPELTSVGEMSILQFALQDGDEGDERYWPKEGYEYRKVYLSTTFGDANTQNYGALIRDGLMDYYTGESFFEQDSLTINYYGEDIECRIISEMLTYEWYDGVLLYEFIYAVQVPVGYDGIVLAIYDGGLGTTTAGGLDNVAESVDAINVEGTGFFRLVV